MYLSIDTSTGYEKITFKSISISLKYCNIFQYQYQYIFRAPAKIAFKEVISKYMLIQNQISYEKQNIELLNVHKEQLPTYKYIPKDFLNFHS